MKSFIAIISLLLLVGCSSTVERGPASDCKNVDPEHKDYFKGPSYCDN